MGAVLGRLAAALVFTILALTVGASASAQPAWAASTAAQAAWATFSHPTFGFTLAYPAGWEVTGEDGPVAMMAVGPRAAGAADLRLSVNVTTERLPPGMTVERFEAISNARMEQLFNGYRRLRADRTAVGGRPAIVRYYTWKRNDGVEVYQVQLYVVAGERAFVVTGTTALRSAALQREVELLVRIVQTFRL